jgi:hypothetical protein
MAKKVKTRAKADDKREASPGEPDPKVLIDPPSVDVAAPEGVSKEEAEAAPEIVSTGVKKIEPSTSPRVPEGADDKDLPIRGIAAFVAGIFGLIGVAAAVSWGIYAALRGDLRAMDPPPSPIPEANEPVLPPEPRLRENPPADMDALRARENAVLKSYGWVDRGAGIGRIPIERAIELAADGKAAAKTEGDKP